mmetsp:Transcript_37317/g.90909  ORF Transcript_37317/g.90909 Transcript_37317/m.90909 type:complete len:175 (+) Transcript_37317:674-1198(+)
MKTPRPRWERREFGMLLSCEDISAVGRRALVPSFNCGGIGIPKPGPKQSRSYCGSKIISFARDRGADRARLRRRGCCPASLPKSIVYFVAMFDSPPAGRMDVTSTLSSARVRNAEAIVAWRYRGLLQRGVLQRGLWHRALDPPSGAAIGTTPAPLKAERKCIGSDTSRVGSLLQ